MIVDAVRRIGRFALIVFEIAILSALILATRCAIIRTFLSPGMFTSPMRIVTRDDACEDGQEKPGLIIRHHAFENFPAGDDSAHDCAAGLSDCWIIVVLKSVHDACHRFGRRIYFAIARVARRLVSWWWSRRMKFRYRWVMLILYAISPILVHGTEFGRPDHQSLLIVLVAIAICAVLEFANSQGREHGEGVVADERCCLGAGDLGFSLRAACPLSDSGGHGSCC